jgi:hypothetical protein
MGDIDGLMKSSIVAALALLAVAGCGHPPPAPKSVATVIEACGAARAYVAFRKSTAHTAVVFPQTKFAAGAAAPETDAPGKTGIGKFPRIKFSTGQVAFALPSDCLAGLPRKPAEPGSPEQRSGTDYAALPVLSADGNEAVILVSEHCDDRRCLSGRLVSLQKDTAGVWTVVEDSAAWVS